MRGWGWNRVLCFGLAGWIGLWMTCGSSHAQVPAYRAPVTSPYLNLLRSGTSPGINYYGIVRPEITFGNSLYQLGAQQNLLQGQQGELANQQTALAAYTQLPATGHTAGFMTQSKYFMSNSGGQGNTFAPGGFGPPPQLKGR